MPLLSLFKSKLQESDIQELVKSLSKSGGRSNPTECVVAKKTIVKLCKQVGEVFLQEPTLLDIKPGDLTVVGDIHGQYEDLLHILEQHNFPPHRRYLLLGDFVDRGARGLEVVCLLFALKLLYPTKVHLIRGNHEAASVNAMYGFQQECRIKADLEVWREVNRVFDALPLAALIGGKMLAVHGGLSFNLYKLQQIRDIKRPIKMDGQPPGLVTDLLWSDPKGGDFSGWANNPRGSGYLFGMDAVREFKGLNPGLERVVRSHQPMDNGYECLGDGDEVITVFSAPKYRGMDNKGAIMHVNHDGGYEFTLMESSRAGKPICMKPSINPHLLRRQSREAEGSSAPGSPTHNS